MATFKYTSHQSLPDNVDYFRIDRCPNELKGGFGCGHVTDGVTTLNLNSVIFYSKCYFHVVWHPP